MRFLQKIRDWLIQEWLVVSADGIYFLQIDSGDEPGFHRAPEKATRLTKRQANKQIEKYQNIPLKIVDMSQAEYKPLQVRGRLS